MSSLIDLASSYKSSGVADLLQQLDHELIGLHPVKTRIREIAALLLVDQARRQLDLVSTAPSLHMSFTGQPGTGVAHRQVWRLATKLRNHTQLNDSQ